MTQRRDGLRGGVAALLATLCLCAGSAHAARAAKLFCGAGLINCPDAPFAGALTSTSGMVWIRLNAPAPARVRYRVADAKAWSTTPDVTTAAESDNTARFALSGLASATTYMYQVGITQADGTQSWSKSSYFRTAEAEPGSLQFTVMADFANKLASSPALRSATAKPNDLMLFIGDMDHRNPADEQGSDSLYAPGDPAVLGNMRAMHQNMRNPAFAIGADLYNGLIASTATHPQTPFYYAWDDHDYCANNQGIDCPARDTAFQAYRENYLWAQDSAMADDSACTSDFQRVSYGNLVDIFMLDARSDRVSTGPAPTMLGACQLNWLQDGLSNSTATWKFIMSPVPFNVGTKSYDAWGEFPLEHQQVLDWISAHGIANVIVLSGDIHSGGAYDDGSHSGLPEFSVPHANMPATWVNTFCRAVYTGSHAGYLADEPGTWTVGSLTPANTVPVSTCLGIDYPGQPAVVSTVGPYPLDGVGAPGYARIELTTAIATVTIYGADGAVRTGVMADGTSSPLSRQFIAQ